MRFAVDSWLLAALLLLAAVVGTRAWLHDHPQYDPWAPLSLDDNPDGWATRRKLARLRDNKAECRAFLTRSDIAFTPLPPAGKAACHRADRQTLAPERPLGLVLHPAGAEATCAVDAGLALWLRHGVQPAARAFLNTRIVGLEHYGTQNCRRIGNGATGRWSEHATGNAIDIAGFILADGRRVRVRRDWRGRDDAARFLHAVRDAACDQFATVLSPDYNAAHADHLHLDQARRGSMAGSFCR
jgi:hypothetical protein